MLRLTAFLLPVDDIEVDFGWVANGRVPIRRDLNEQHVLDRDCHRKEDNASNKQSCTTERRLPPHVRLRSKISTINKILGI